MGDETIIGIVDVVSGEKDPRNLMIIFSILKVIMIEWDISNHAEVIENELGYFADLIDVYRRLSLILFSAISPSPFVLHLMILTESLHKISRAV